MTLFRQDSRSHQNEDILKWLKALLELLEFESGVDPHPPYLAAF